jgi:hypothetical protein
MPEMLLKDAIMLKTLKSIYVNSFNWYNTRIVPDKSYVEKMFERKMGYKLNLSDPQTLNEKIQWLKLYDRTKMHTLCADKYAVRDYVASLIGEDYLVPLIFQTDDANKIDAALLPDYPFIIKPNHTSGNYIIVTEKKYQDWDEIRKKCRIWLKMNIYYRSKEWQYKKIKPRIIVEKFLSSGTNNMRPNDYKVHCFHGEARMISVDVGRGTQNHFRNWYNKNWQREPYKWSALLNGHLTDPSPEDIEKPNKLNELVSLSEKLTNIFKYARVDWYIIDEKFCFGEITFHHDSGFRPIEPKEWDLKLGSLLKLK